MLRKVGFCFRKKGEQHAQDIKVNKPVVVYNSSHHSFDIAEAGEMKLRRHPQIRGAERNKNDDVINSQWRRHAQSHYLAEYYRHDRRQVGQSGRDGIVIQPVYCGKLSPALRQFLDESLFTWGCVSSISAGCTAGAVHQMGEGAHQGSAHWPFI